MKLNDEQIVDAARRLRDAENASMEVKPWTRNRRWHWGPYVAVPVAVAIGFVLGFFLRPSDKVDDSMVARVDTVFVKSQIPDTVTMSTAMQVARGAVREKVDGYHGVERQAVRHAATVKGDEAECLSVADDNIRYDLLVNR
jgi:hypothetical protein